MVRVKICGITNQEDAKLAVQLGAWALGFIFYKKSPRSIAPSAAGKIIKRLPPFVAVVGVFVNEKQAVVRKTAEACGLTTLQFHGDETPAYCRKFKGYKIIKAFRFREGFDFSLLSKFDVDAYLVDSYDPILYGGTGRPADWAAIAGLKFNRPLIVSGGLNPRNVSGALGALHPFAIDVSSGVEENPGKKHPKLLVQLFKNIIAYKERGNNGSSRL